MKPKIAMEQRTFKNYDDEVPELFKAIKDCKWTEVLDRCKYHPEEANIWVFKTNLTRSTVQWCVLPIHQACAREAPEPVISGLLKANPTSISAKGYQMSQQDRKSSPDKIDQDSGNLPIHYACEWGAAIEVLTQLLIAHPEAIKESDRRGLTPLEIVQRGENANKAEAISLLKEVEQHGVEFLAGDQGSRVAKLEKENAVLKRKLHMLVDALKLLMSGQQDMIDTALRTKKDMEDVEGLLQDMHISR
mmetsp:Transcript_1565/g.2138  ORF Transcript_1565/g.2138 Transcript_1565/m.2138 type:complete len:247 (-) Transcript_1565:1743-2483(-)